MVRLFPRVRIVTDFRPSSSRFLVGLVVGNYHACYLLGGGGKVCSNPAWTVPWRIWLCLVSDWLAGG